MQFWREIFLFVVYGINKTLRCHSKHWTTLPISHSETPQIVVKSYIAHGLLSKISLSLVSSIHILPLFLKGTWSWLDILKAERVVITFCFPSKLSTILCCSVENVKVQGASVTEQSLVWFSYDLKICQFQIFNEISKNVIQTTRR